MSHHIHPTRLLRQARVLAGVGAGRGRPSPTNHRRAVSAAYYALFHAVNLSAVRYVLPTAAPEREVYQGTRWINHTDVRVVCEAVAACAASLKPVASPKGLPVRAIPLWHALSRPAEGDMRISHVPADLRFVTDTFLTLQAARHRADYDHLAEFPKATTLGYVEDAAYAVDRLNDRTDDPSFQRFYAWVVARSSAFVA